MVYFLFYISEDTVSPHEIDVALFEVPPDKQNCWVSNLRNLLITQDSSSSWKKGKSNKRKKRKSFLTEQTNMVILSILS